MTVELDQLSATLPRSLRHLAFRMRRELEAAAEYEEVTPGLTSEGRTENHARLIAHFHQAATSMLATYSSSVQRAKDVGDVIPARPDTTLVDRMRAVQDLDGAYTLVDELRQEA